MNFDHTINDPVVKSICLDYDEALLAEMLIMERICPVYYRACEVEKRELWVEVLRMACINSTRLVFYTAASKGNGSTEYKNSMKSIQ